MREETARCDHCSAAFSAQGGVIDLLPQVLRQPGPAQRAMEWPPLARIYESRLWRRSPLVASALGCTFEEERALVLRSLALRRDSRVLDLACGPGIYTRPIARAVPQGVALGLDISWPMLSCAAARARDESIDNIVWLRASAMDVPIADASLDGVNCCAALHLLPDLSQALSEILRVLKPKGRFTGGMVRRVDGPLGDLEVLMMRWAGATPRGNEELRSLLEKVGFGDVKIRYARRVWQIASAIRPG